MLKIQNRFLYEKIEKVDTETGRLYLVPKGDPLPSVTTILSETKDMSGINAWRGWVGEARADKIVKEATDIGSLMHEKLEDYVLQRNQTPKTNLIHKIAEKMARRIIDEGLSILDSVHGLEVQLYYEGLYAGTTDLVAEYNGEIVIADYKNSKKIKEDKYLVEYKLQLCAYSLAHDNMYGTNITKGLIFMVTRPNEKNTKLDDIQYKTIILEGEEFQEYKMKWLEILELFYKGK